MIYCINETSSESISESIFNFKISISNIFHEYEINIMNEKYNFLCENGYEIYSINENYIKNTIAAIKTLFDNAWDKIKKWFKDKFAKIKKIKNPDKKAVQSFTNKYKEAEKRYNDVNKDYKEMNKQTDNDVQNAKEYFEDQSEFYKNLTKLAQNEFNEIRKSMDSIDDSIDKIRSSGKNNGLLDELLDELKS